MARAFKHKVVECENGCKGSGFYKMTQTALMSLGGTCRCGAKLVEREYDFPENPRGKPDWWLQQTLIAVRAEATA